MKRKKQIESDYKEKGKILYSFCDEQTFLRRKKHENMRINLII